MYEQFFHLARAPFAMTPDPEFLYMTPGHREALAGLVYAVAREKGLVVLSGDAGTGKTTLLRRLQAMIHGTKTRFAFITNPTLTAREFLELMLLRFGLADIPESKAQRLVRFQRFLHCCQRGGQTPVLVVDEAHKLGPELLEEVRLLMNFETHDQKLVQVILAGQTELRTNLRREELRQLQQRVAVRLELQPLTAAQIPQYIEHRWKLAGAAAAIPFGEDAIELITRFSRGIPRIVNSICDNALLLAYGSGASRISAAAIREVVADLDLADAPPALKPAGRTALELPPLALRPAQSPPEVALPSFLRNLPQGLPEKPNFFSFWARRFGFGRS